MPNAYSASAQGDGSPSDPFRPSLPADTDFNAWQLPNGRYLVITPAILSAPGAPGILRLRSDTELAEAAQVRNDRDTIESDRRTWQREHSDWRSRKQTAEDAGEPFTEPEPTWTEPAPPEDRLPADALRRRIHDIWGPLVNEKYEQVTG